jgi:hypothetical protein
MTSPCLILDAGTRVLSLLDGATSAVGIFANSALRLSVTYAGVLPAPTVLGAQQGIRFVDVVVFGHYGDVYGRRGFNYAILDILISAASCYLLYISRYIAKAL